VAVGPAVNRHYRRPSAKDGTPRGRVIREIIPFVCRWTGGWLGVNIFLASGSFSGHDMGRGAGCGRARRTTGPIRNLTIHVDVFRNVPLNDTRQDKFVSHRGAVLSTTST